jgi:hypothetical protein
MCIIINIMSKNKLIAVQQWNYEKHGSKYKNINYIHFMEKKNIIIESVDDINQFYQKYSEYLYDTHYILSNKQYSLNQCHFANKNVSFYKFIQKCKHYYSNKLKQKKNPTRLFLRQLYGTYRI